MPREHAHIVVPSASVNVIARPASTRTSNFPWGMRSTDLCIGQNSMSSFVKQHEDTVVTLSSSCRWIIQWVDSSVLVSGTTYSSCPGPVSLLGCARVTRFGTTILFFNLSAQDPWAPLKRLGLPPHFRTLFMELSGSRCQRASQEHSRCQTQLSTNARKHHNSTCARHHDMQGSGQVACEGAVEGCT